MASFAWLAALTLRGTVVLAVALGLGRVLRRRSSAAARHRLLTLTALGSSFFPVLPAVRRTSSCRCAARVVGGRGRGPLVVQLLRPIDGAPVDAVEAPPRLIDPASPTQHERALPPARESSFGTALGTGAVTLWLAGILASLVGLGKALRRGGNSWRLQAPRWAWLDTLERPPRSLNWRGLRLRPPRDRTPSRGLAARRVLVPAAETWDEERRLLVVSTAVHVARADGLRQLAAAGGIYSSIRGSVAAPSGLAGARARRGGGWSRHASLHVRATAGDRPESLRPRRHAFATRFPWSNAASSNGGSS